MSSLLDKPIVVTGAAGFIGANLAIALVNQGAKVHALVRSTTNLWRLGEIRNDIILHTVDLTDLDLLNEIIGNVKPQVIFHLAAESGHHEDTKGRVDAIQSSVLGTLNLIESISSLESAKLIHIGSSLEYGRNNKALNESDLLQPETFRGAIKAAATLICRQYAISSENPVIILRLFSVYGYFEQPERLISRTILAALDDGEISLTRPGYVHDYVFIDDVVRGCMLALDAQIPGGEIINIGSGKQTTNEEIVRLIQEISGKEITVKEGDYPERSFDTTNWVADIEKARKLLNWNPRCTLTEGLDNTISWLMENKSLYYDL